MCQRAVPAGFREISSFSGWFQYDYRRGYLKSPKNNACGGKNNACGALLVPVCRLGFIWLCALSAVFRNLDIRNAGRRLGKTSQASSLLVMGIGFLTSLLVVAHTPQPRVPVVHTEQDTSAMGRCQNDCTWWYDLCSERFFNSFAVFRPCILHPRKAARQE
jgi:hypothetical protein